MIGLHKNDINAHDNCRTPIEDASSLGLAPSLKPGEALGGRGGRLEALPWLLRLCSQAVLCWKRAGSELRNALLSPSASSPPENGSALSQLLQSTRCSLQIISLHLHFALTAVVARWHFLTPPASGHSLVTSTPATWSLGLLLCSLCNHWPPPDSRQNAPHGSSRPLSAAGERFRVDHHWPRLPDVFLTYEYNLFISLRPC
jgi:hypothetical protein